ncbi:hypothetical protein Ahy_A07g035838 isoform A [Arachis hypogaea]|uniref:FAR1 domain-containing protein n=1 Tax=Arachis hypogaea TaxID=3818 RepID=A0A445CEM2_ARAHY|nr:hypothetical protein Ahy_A07g035838 isoform A [Arachis hypogaea]
MYRIPLVKRRSVHIRLGAEAVGQRDPHLHWGNPSGPAAAPTATTAAAAPTATAAAAVPTATTASTAAPQPRGTHRHRSSSPQLARAFSLFAAAAPRKLRRHRKSCIAVVGTSVTVPGSCVAAGESSVAVAWKLCGLRHLPCSSALSLCSPVWPCPSSSPSLPFLLAAGKQILGAILNLVGKLEESKCLQLLLPLVDRRCSPLVVNVYTAVLSSPSRSSVVALLVVVVTSVPFITSGRTSLLGVRAPFPVNLARNDWCFGATGLRMEGRNGLFGGCEEFGNAIGSICKNDSAENGCDSEARQPSLDDDASDYGDVIGLTAEDICNKVFRSEERAYDFFAKLGKFVGFGVRKGDYGKDEEGNLIRRRFFCNKAGLRDQKHYNRVDRKRSHRPETRTNCKAMLSVYLDRVSCTWKVRKVNLEHNHPLTPRTIVHMIPGFRRMSESAKAHIDGMQSDKLWASQMYEK